MLVSTIDYSPYLGRLAILRVRNGEKTKTGVGVNLEQAIGAGMGVFLRAMRSDGRTETYAFTEVDQSLAAGTFVEGSNWGRARDAASARTGPQRRRGRMLVHPPAEVSSTKVPRSCKGTSAPYLGSRGPDT